MPQDSEKDGRVENEDTHVSHDHMVVQAQDHPQDLIIESPSKVVMTRSQKLASFIAHHTFVSCFEPTKVEEAL